MQPWGDTVEAITLFTEDLAVSQAFYRTAFGKEPAFEDADSCVFAFGTVMVNLLVVSAADELVAPHPVGGAGLGARALLTVPVPDVDATAAALAEAGVPLLNGPVDRPWGIRTAAFADPSGHVWEVAAPLER